MEIIVTPDRLTGSKQAAAYMAARVAAKADTVLGLATGSTPIELYGQLIRAHREEGLDFSRCVTFNLDEYVGLPSEHPASYAHFMRVNLFDALNIPKKQTHIPDGMAADIPAYCASYEATIRDAGGIDLQLLGIGSDGHIGFNEPTSSLASRTRLKTLTEITRRDNAKYFESDADIPHHVITMGIGTIMEAREILLLAFGAAKADAVAAMVEGPLSAMVPASILQMHPVVKVFVDEDAAGKLKRLSYYKRVFSNKPSWQTW